MAKIGPWLAGVLATLGLVADVQSLLGIPRTIFVAFALLVGVTITGLGAILYGREWNKPLGWRATRAAATAAAGVALTTTSLVGLVPKLVEGAGGVFGPASVPTTLRTGQSLDLDSKNADSEPDIYVEAGFVDAILVTPDFGTSIFVRVPRPTSEACASAAGWADRISPVQGHLICITTDAGRFVVIEVLSTDDNLVTFKLVHESNAPTP